MREWYNRVPGRIVSLTRQGRFCRSARDIATSLSHTSLCVPCKVRVRQKSAIMGLHPEFGGSPCGGNRITAGTGDL